MNITQNPQRGYAFLQSGGDIDELARALTTGMVRHVPSPMDVPRIKGAVKAFSFHWSNAQARWDVVIWKDFPWGLDGAEFILFIGKDALSPLDQLWSLAEMKYVAKKLGQHPGFGFSVRATALTQKWLGAQIRSARLNPVLAAAAWEGKALTAAIAGVYKVVRATLPGTSWEYTVKGTPKYSYDDPAPLGSSGSRSPTPTRPGLGCSHLPRSRFKLAGMMPDTSTW